MKKAQRLYEQVDWDELARQTERHFAQPGRVVVSMNRAKEAEIAPGGEPIELFTPSVGGCTVVAIVVQTRDGSRRAFLSHYDPLSVMEQGDGIDRFLKKKRFTGGKAFLTLPEEEQRRTGQEDPFQDLNADFLETILSLHLRQENVLLRRYVMELGTGSDVRLVVQPNSAGFLATISAHAGFTAQL